MLNEIINAYKCYFSSNNYSLSSTYYMFMNYALHLYNNVMK